MVLQGDARSGMGVDTAIDGTLPLVSGDEKALTECFGHIIANAMEALARHANPHIVLSAKEYKDGEILSGVAISVQDNGRGIAADLKGKVFSPFCTTKARGMGLGLPIVKRTVIDHNGRVCVESSEKGTCVTIVLPAAKVKPSELLDESYRAESGGTPPKQDPLSAKTPEERPAPSPNSKTRPMRTKTSEGRT
jgi:C4-dicarboxylate-specific signal transduction histidine kinase